MKRIAGHRLVKKLGHQIDISPSEHLSVSTRWRRKRVKPSRDDKAAKQQFLTPQEEDALKTFVRNPATTGTESGTRQYLYQR